MTSVDKVMMIKVIFGGKTPIKHKLGLLIKIWAWISKPLSLDLVKGTFLNFAMGLQVCKSIEVYFCLKKPNGSTSGIFT